MAVNFPAARLAHHLVGYLAGLVDKLTLLVFPATTLRDLLAAA
jgi:hypothetical protein